MIVIYLLVLLCGVSADIGRYQKHQMTSYDDVTTRDINEEQELDRLLADLVESKDINKTTEPKLQCYSCTSTESWEDCEKKQVLVSCPGDATHCITATITINDNENRPTTEYYKSCVTHRKCHTQHYPACKTGTEGSAHAQCEIECCDVRQCNKGQDRHDKRSFSFNCQPPCLVYATLHEINGIELKTSRKVPGLTSLPHVTPVGVDIATRTLYWSDKINHVIKRTSLVSGVSEVLIGGEKGWYEGVAVDWVNRLIYWTDRVHQRIEAAGLNGSSRRLVVGKDLVKPRAIVVDPRYGFIFWTDLGKGRPRIERASLSGQHRQVLVSTDIRWPNGLVLDCTSRRVYFCDSEFHRIESMNYDGTDRRVLYSDSTIHPFDLALFDSTLFWSDWSTRSIEKVDINTGKRLGNFGVLSVDRDRIAGVAVLDASRQPQDFPKSSTTTKPSTVLTTKQTTLKSTTTKRSTTVTTTEQVTTLPTTPETTTVATTVLPSTTTTTTTTTVATSVPSTTTTTPETTTQRPTTTASTARPTTATTPSVGLRVRLVGGAMPSEGRVEVFHNGQWGTICDDLWDLRDAMVVCHMLGYSGAISEYRGGFYGNGQGPVWLDNVNCIGDESSIAQCSHRGWGVHNCRHSEDAGVKCQPLHTQKPGVQVRLVNGRGPHEGRVEVLHEGRWGTVCDDLWSKKDADVICRMLGYPAAAMATILASYGPGSGPIWLDNVRCRGDERTIEECSHQGWGRSNCRHSEDAGVICQPKATVLPPPTTPAPPAPLRGFAIICLPRSMYIRISRKHLQQMMSHDFDPVSLHLNDPSCGVIKADDAHVLLGTSLTACETERRQIDDSLTFTNKVIVDSSWAKRIVRRSSPFEFPFRCSYIRTNTKRMIGPPRRKNGKIGQW